MMRAKKEKNGFHGEKKKQNRIKRFQGKQNQKKREEATKVGDQKRKLQKKERRKTKASIVQHHAPSCNQNDERGSGKGEKNWLNAKKEFGKGKDNSKKCKAWGGGKKGR